MSGDPKQEHLSDGLTEQIIASISKIPDLFVISRTSSFKYIGKSVDVRQVGLELGVKYVLEGSFQRSGVRLRITAQLIEAATGKHLWAKQYQRPDKDFFAIQDDITLKIMGALAIKLTAGEQLRFQKPGTKNLKAVEKILEAIVNIRKVNLESNNIAKKLAAETIALDPNFSSAYSLLALTYVMDVWLGGSKSRRESFTQAFKLLEKSISLDANNDFAHSLLGHIYGMMGRFDRALAEGKLAVSLNPNSDNALVYLAQTLNYAGKPQEAIALYKKAMRLSPFPPS